MNIDTVLLLLQTKVDIRRKTCTRAFLIIA